MRSLPWLGASLGLAIAAPAYGQEQQADRVQYPASFFEDFAPQTALDIVQRTPGFSLDEGQDVRGFGAAAGNVLIDGARPSVKGGGLSEFLSRIPADQVLEVQLLRNAQTAEAQGQAVVLNIIRRPVETSGSWSLGLERTGTAPIVPQGSVSVAGQALGWEGSLEFTVETDKSPIRTLRSFSSPNGTLTSSWQEHRVESAENYNLAGDARRPLWGGVLSLNARAGTNSYRVDRQSRIFTGRRPSRSPDQLAVFQSASDSWQSEFGVDFARSFGPNAFKAVGLLSVGHETDEDRNTQRTAAGVLQSLSATQTEDDTLEAVIRATIGLPLREGLRVETGGEVAFNRRDSSLIFTEDGVGVRLQGANTLVEEVRGEAFVTFAYQASEALRIEGGLAAETSEISVSGDAQNTQRFTFWKPSLSASYDLGAGAQVRLGVERSVGQLAFGDFAASARIGDGQTTAGNPALGPEASWTAHLDLDWRRDNGFALTVETFREEREGALEQIRLPTGGVGVGNAGTATLQGISLSLDAPVGRLIPGGLVSVSAESVNATVFDPLIGRDRDPDGMATDTINVSFRQDPPGLPFSWGISFQGPVERTAILINEIDQRGDRARVDLFAETTAFFGLKTRLDIRNVGTARFTRARQRFTPDRSGALASLEERRAAFGAVFALEVSGQF